MDHPLVTDYLRRLERASSGVPRGRRRALLEDVGEHLREVVPTGASDEQARRAIEDFGAPEHLADEAFGRREPDPQREDGVGAKHPLAPRVLSLAATVALLAGGVLATHALTRASDDEPDVHAEGASTVNASDGDAGTASFVTAEPRGEPRTQEGRAYAEYQVAIADLPHPLPPGAVYPAGVPEGLDGGVHEDAVMEVGAGATTAHFTWLCAWEVEYLTAFYADDHPRVLVAEDMLRAFPDVVPPSWTDTATVWAPMVTGPLDFADPSGVEKDVRGTCMQAGIYPVEVRPPEDEV
ncbi:hypothetical protein [Actinotalea sp. C106]|uniref:HAAS signaling domain-containing protein n=1 Tax=Actinotalea sp. C106 TaxID=2908644 RepID=UPI002027B56F|nr:hypothetical protein [Actinotalea sp. C106]